MSIQTLKDQLPEYAKDLGLNLRDLASETLLSGLQKAGTFIATALASRNPQIIEALVAQFAPGLEEKSPNAVKAAAAIMSMNNVYYRFLHLADGQDFHRLPPSCV